MELFIQSIDLHALGSRNYYPSFYTVGEVRYKGETCTIKPWDGKTDVIAWFHHPVDVKTLISLHPTAVELLNKDDMVEFKPIPQVELFRTGDVLTVSVPSMSVSNIKVVHCCLGFPFTSKAILDARTEYMKSGKIVDLMANEPVHVVDGKAQPFPLKNVKVNASIYSQGDRLTMTIEATSIESDLTSLEVLFGK